MKHFARHALAAAVAVVATAPSWAQTDENNESPIEEVYVYGEPGKTDAATKLNLTVMETPQTVTSISAAQIKDFGLDSLRDVLNYAPGITVEEVETDRTYFTARGFDVVNFQYDGVGIPFISGNASGLQDTALYEKVELIKGAAGLVTGLANPSATVNYVRKRPTDEFQGSTSLSVSRWSGRRAEVDVSSPLSDRVSGRVVAAYDQGESHLDRHEAKNTLGYGILRFDVTDSSQLHVGYSYNNSDSDSVLWGALPLVNALGQQVHYDRSTSTAPDWTFSENTQKQFFVEYSQELNENWSFDAQFVQNTSETESELFYVFGQPDPTTGLGLAGSPSRYLRDEDQKNGELFFTGNIDAFGQEHQIVIGYSHSDTNIKQKSISSDGGIVVLGSDWAAGNTPRPNFTVHNPATQVGDVDLKQKAFYAAARINVMDNLSLLLGARNTDLEQSGLSYGGQSNASAKETVPYYGLTWNILDDLVFYASYTEVFKQQTWLNTDLLPLGPTLGESTEFGFKKSFNDERATLTIARFSSEQSNFGVFIGRNAQNVAMYRGATLESEGYEIEFSGEIIDGLNIGAGFTVVDIEEEGQDARPFIPEKLLKVSTSYDIPAVEGLRIGAVIKHQDDTTTPLGLVKQDAYSTIDLAAHYKLNQDISFSLNVTNATDKTYLSSLYWDQAYYGSPRNISASVNYKF
ncbi:MAG: TonB-dependent siderophore receptor [Cellvibrionaceae bacterium]|nr:TonB-dependent siderophore receptor [Cellvibrionaceae bacterium]